MILERWEQSPDYPYIDTKIDVITGRNFSDDDEFFKRQGIIYSWIQGRALEALTGHAVWLSECSILDDAGRNTRISKIKEILSKVISAMEKLREKNCGKMFFAFNANGASLDVVNNTLLISQTEESNYSDLFYSKGLLCASDSIGNKGMFHLWQKVVDTRLDASA